MKKMIHAGLIFFLIVLIAGITSAVSGPVKENPVEWGPGDPEVAGNGTIGYAYIGWTNYSSSWATCPSGCTCLGEKNAKNQGRIFCMNVQEQPVCGMNELGENMYCYSDTIPVTTTLPTTQSGTTLTPTPSLTTASSTTPSSGSAVVLSGCGSDCRCILPEAADSLGLPLCGGSPVLCNYDTSGRGMYCYALARQTVIPTTQGMAGNQAALTSCPGDCTCLNPEVANQIGLPLCGNTPVLCNYDRDGTPMYCYNRAGVVPGGETSDTSSATGIPLGIFTIIGAVAGTIMVYGYNILKKT